MRNSPTKETLAGMKNMPATTALEEDLRRLIDRLRQGDETAFLPLYHATSTMVAGLAIRILRDPDAAEDVTSDVYLQVYQQASHYQAMRGTPSAWLRTLTRSRAIDRLRRESARQQREVSIEPQTLPSSLPNPEAYSTTTELRQVVQTALTTLSQEQRQVIEIAYYTGLSHREIAAKLDQPLGTIKTRLRLGIKALQQQLRPLLADTPSAQQQPHCQRREEAAA